MAKIITFVWSAVAQVYIPVGAVALLALRCSSLTSLGHGVHAEASHGYPSILPCFCSQAGYRNRIQKNLLFVLLAKLSSGSSRQPHKKLDGNMPGGMTHIPYQKLTASLRSQALPQHGQTRSQTPGGQSGYSNWYNRTDGYQFIEAITISFVDCFMILWGPYFGVSSSCLLGQGPHLWEHRR